MKPWILAASVSIPLTLSSGLHTAEATAERPVSQGRATKAKTVTISGYISSCYKPNRWIVFVTSLPSGKKPRFESKSITVGPDGRFAVIVDPAKAPPGRYVLEFGEDKKGTGGLVFTLKSENIDLGEIGDCDV